MTWRAVYAKLYRRVVPTPEDDQVLCLEPGRHVLPCHPSHVEPTRKTIEEKTVAKTVLRLMACMQKLCRLLRTDSTVRCTNSVASFARTRQASMQKLSASRGRCQRCFASFRLISPHFDLNRPQTSSLQKVCRPHRAHALGKPRCKSVSSSFTHSAGLEPTQALPNRFLVDPLNRSGTSASG